MYESMAKSSVRLCSGRVYDGISKKPISFGKQVIVWIRINILLITGIAILKSEP